MDKLFQALLDRADLFPQNPALISDAGNNQEIITNQQLLQKIANVEVILKPQKVKCVGLSKR